MDHAAYASDASGFQHVQGATNVDRVIGSRHFKASRRAVYGCKMENQLAISDSARK